MIIRISTLPFLVLALIWFNTRSSEPIKSMVTDECSFAQNIPEVEDYLRLISFADPYLGNFDATVTVIEYFDPNCPHCKTLHSVMKQVIADNGQRARFFMIPFVLWPYSVPQAEALFVAGQEGKYFEMLDAQYEAQRPGGMSVDELVALAKDIGLDPVKFKNRMDKELNQGMIMTRREEIRALGVQGTPAVMINGKFIESGSKSLVCINELIMKEAAIKQG